MSFKISDTATGNPLSGLRPAAWIDQREARQTTGKDCREKIQAFLQGSLSARPTIDLNSYYLLAMNREPTISVIDPLIGYGTTKLLTLVFLNNPGEDWVQWKEGKKIFVTMPASNQVAVVDTVSFKVVANITTGIKPSRIACAERSEIHLGWLRGGTGSKQSRGCLHNRHRHQQSRFEHSNRIRRP